MIEINSLRVDYEDITAVQDLNLFIPEGQIYGLVGPNGAGKTSAIKAIAGILEPTYGEIKINSIDMEIEPEKALQLIGFMPDFPPVYENLTVWEYCDVFAAAYLIKRTKRLERSRYWIEQVNLLGKWDTYVRDLSRGMRQRLILAKTLLPDPKILLLDEPASGLDPLARKEFRDLLKKVAAQGMTVMISSHILTELSDFCNAVGIMEKGKLVVSGSIEDIRKKVGTSGELFIRVAKLSAAKKDLLLHGLTDCPFLSDHEEIGKNEYKAVFTGTQEEASQLLTYFVSQKIAISDFHVKEADVEDIFFKIGAQQVS